MKVAVLYCYTVGASEPWVPHDFNAVHKRFVDSYKKFPPKIPHVLMPVLYRGEKDSTAEKLFAGLDVQWAYYPQRLNGFDMGVWQEIGGSLDVDFVLCCNSQNYFHRDGWLERLVEAHKQYPTALIGPWGSYENSPHIRGACMAAPPKTIRKYPHRIDSRVHSYSAESGELSITKWANKEGIPAMMVTWDEILTQDHWRKPPNIFRRGDQSNCIIWDRHTKVYADANASVKAALERAADGLNNPPAKTISRPSKVPIPVKAHKTITVVAVCNVAPMAHVEAINRTAASIPHQCKKLLLSPEKPEGFEGEWKSIPDWMPNGEWSLKRMCDFLTYGLHKHITTDIAILVHWDGFAINRSKWTDEFLKYDYIGAPWPKAFRYGAPRVGNGGFSIRSKLWLTAASRLPKPPVSMEASEDVYTCAKNHEHFTRAGCRFAPLSIAMRWSMEHRIEEFPNWKLSDSFGFHGLTNTDPARKHLQLDKTK